MKRALVLSAETPSACATVRGLHDADFEVVVLAEGLLSPAAASWRASRARRVGVWEPDELPRLVREVAPDVVVPVTEGDLLRLGPVRAEVEDVAPVVAPAPDVLLRATDKVAMLAVAAELDIAVPEQVVYAPDDEVGDIGAADLPVVVKPARSRVLLRDGTVWGETASWAVDPFDVRAAHREFKKAGVATVVQRPVRGTPILASVLVREDGEASLWFVHRRVRQARPEGGPSACALSHPPEPRFVERAVELAHETGITNVPVQFEYVVPDDGEPVLLDVNPRPWGTLGLALDCGVNFYGMAARHALGEALPAPPPAYREGVARHYLPFELRYVWAVVFSERPEGYTGVWPKSKLDTLLGWGYLPTEGLVGRLDDPLPALADALRLVARAVTGG